jgi:hypothetical protein
MSPRAHRWVALVALVLLAPGCVLPAMNRKRTGRVLSTGDAAAVAKGVTKADLFERLGPPMAIAARGEDVHVPAANVHHVDEMSKRTRWFGGDAWVQQGDAWFELFASRRALEDTHRVYYWYSTSEGGWALFFLVSYSTRSSTTAELWVLVDEATGRADDAFFLVR